ncbi:MAG: HAMP domain-containing sensor histidine kinase [Tissierellaceae bacterium]
MERYSPKLRIYFTLLIFTIMLSAALIMGFLAFLLLKTGHLNLTNRNPLSPLWFILFMSVIIGTSISAFVANKILKPITDFSIATDKIAKGDFDIRIDEDSPIEEIRDLAKNFNIMAQELSGIETLKNDFITNVSHEFKTPIAAIEGYATLLQGDISNPEYADYTQMIIQSARQLNSLSNNILSLSKLENQEIILEKVSYRLDEQIRSAVLMLEPEWSPKNLDLQIDLINAEYVGNESFLMQVWLNLISNAIKFTPENGYIQIRLIKEDYSLIFTITDNGIGINKTNINHIFDKFYQGDITRKTVGNGLGLALAKRIIDLSNGSISVKSVIEKGTTFTVRLPVAL